MLLFYTGSCGDRRMKEQLSVRASWVLAIVAAYEQTGGDGDLILQEQDLNREELCRLGARLSIGRGHRVWGAVLSRVKDPNFCLQVGRDMPPSTFGPLGSLVLVAPSPMAALQYISRYFDVLCNLGSITLEEEGDQVHFRVSSWTSMADLTAASISAFSVAVVRMLRLLSANPLNPAGVCLGCRPAAEEDAYQRYFACPVSFACGENRISFWRSDLEQPLPNANPELLRYLEQQVTEEIARLRRVDFSAQVYGKLCELLPQGPVTQCRIAQALNVSVRKLQWQLQQENTSYRDIFNQVRHSLASQYLADSRMSVSEIALRLGFTNASNFCRTFRQWRECSPTDYRAQFLPVH